MDGVTIDFLGTVKGVNPNSGGREWSGWSVWEAVAVQWDKDDDGDDDQEAETATLSPWEIRPEIRPALGHLLPASPTQGSTTALCVAWRRRVLRRVEELSKDARFAAFASAVDLDAVHGYGSAVPLPMDLGRIR